MLFLVVCVHNLWGLETSQAPKILPLSSRQSVGPRPEHAVAQFCDDAARVINLAIDARRFGEVSCNFI
jgi:hypothetical protein